MSWEYSKVSQSLWHSKRFRALGEDAKLVYLHALTGPHGNSVGCFRLPVGYVTADLGWPQDRATKALKEVSDSGLLDLYPDEDLLRIDKFLDHNPCTNMKHAAGAARACPWIGVASSISARSLD